MLRCRDDSPRSVCCAAARGHRRRRRSPARTSPSPRRRSSAALQKSSGTLRGDVAHGARRRVREDNRRLATLASRRPSCLARRGERSTSMPSQFISRTTLRRTATARRAPACRSPNRPTGCCVVVGERHVAGAEAIEHAQRAERVVDRVPAFHADQRCDLAGLEDALHVVGGQGQLEVSGYFRIIRWTMSICSRVAVTACWPCMSDWHVDRPELTADAAGAAAERCRYESPAAAREMSSLSRSLAAFWRSCPRIVVVAVDQRDLRCATAARARASRGRPPERSS